MQTFLRISLKNRDFLPAYYWPGVYLRCHEVDGAAGYFDAGGEGLADGVETAKDRDASAVTRSIRTAGAVVGQEGGMDVDDAARELFQEVSAEDAHPAGQHDEVNLEETQPGGEPGFAFGAVLPGQVHGLQVMSMGAFQAVGVDIVADDQRDGDAGQFVAFDGVDQSLQVGAGTGDEDAQAQRGLLLRAVFFRVFGRRFHASTVSYFALEGFAFIAACTHNCCTSSSACVSSADRRCL